ncbi:MAG: glutamine-synthetase adenylyltransferase [Roseovarius sp.]|nr:glutamine-synthetase adenylyltransferase [Roseovarius sp.]
MEFSSRITRLPRPFDPDHGAEARARVPGLGPDLADLVNGAAGCSPYLKMLIEAEADWFSAAVADPEEARDTVFASMHDPDRSPEQTASALRQAKRRIALLAGLADLAGVWPLEEVTGTLTDLADHAVQAALTATVGREIRRGKLPGKTEADIDTCAGMVVLAMGKMGAHELNYSSDIDLICLFDETGFAAADYHDARAALIRATRRMASMLSDKTSEGYVFRTDLRLRPDPAVTPVCMAMAAAETYYESLGRTWERAAYVKARPCAGDVAAGDRFLEVLRPFVWRKHLDFAAIEDAHNMRLRIREHKGLGGPLTLPGHDMKLGRGGIREIEFFTQTRQIIAGGRDPDLRVRATVEGLARLADKGWIGADTAQILTRHYRFHREVEHRLQMLRDAQTHALPTSEDEFARLAAFMGRETDDLKADLLDRLTEVHTLIEGFFSPEDTSGMSTAETRLDSEVIERWYGYPALRSSRAVEIFKRLRPDILSRLAATAHPNEALMAFDGFLAGLPAGVQVFSLFEANPHLIDLMVDIAGTSPKLAAHLSQNAAVLDAVIAGDFFAPWPGRPALQEALSRRLDREDDYERKLDAARRWCKEWHFRIGVHHLRGLVDADLAGAQYADLAQATIAALWPAVLDQFATKHGRPPGRGAVVLGMGSLGAARLNAGSDLDLIVIYDAPGDAMSDGKRPLMARQYYARLTQALITAVTAPTAEGRLYEVDMRLRPSGNQGPVATSWTAFREYQRHEAWAWEHLALTRARVIAGTDEIADDVETFRAEMLMRKGRDREVILREVAEMRARIARAKTPDGPLDAKLGHGRLQEVELIAQAGSLMKPETDRSVAAGLDACVAIGWLDDGERNALAGAHALCWSLLQASRLLSEAALDPEKLGEGGVAFVLKATGEESMETLMNGLETSTQKAGAVIDAALARVPGGPPHDT